MIRWFVKYGFVIFLFNTIFYSISLTKDTIAPIVFYITMELVCFFNIKSKAFKRSFIS